MYVAKNLFRCYQTISILIRLQQIQSTLTVSASTQHQEPELGQTRTRTPENQRAQVLHQTQASGRRIPDRATPYTLPIQLWSMPWLPRQSTNLITLEDSIDAAIFDEAVDGLDDAPCFVISGPSVAHLAQSLLSEVKEAARNHDFTKLLSKNREFNMYLTFSSRCCDH